MAGALTLKDIHIQSAKRRKSGITAQDVYEDIEEGLTAKEIRKKRGISHKGLAKAFSAICSEDHSFFQEKYSKGRLAGQKVDHVIWIDECVTDKLGGFVLAQLGLTSRHLLFMDRQGKSDRDNYYEAARQGVSAILTFDIRDKSPEDLAVVAMRDVLDTMRDTSMTEAQSLKTLRQERPKIIQVVLEDNRYRAIYPALRAIDRGQLREYLDNPSGPFIRATRHGLMPLPHRSYEQITREGLYDIHKGYLRDMVREQAERWTQEKMDTTYADITTPFARERKRREVLNDALRYFEEMEIERGRSEAFTKLMRQKAGLDLVA